MRRSVSLANELFELVSERPELEAFTTSVSMTTFRYRPADLGEATPETEAYLKRLNRELLSRLQSSGEVFVSNAVLGETFVCGHVS